MTKQQITIERVLRSNSPNIIWQQLSQIDRLACWLADDINEVGDKLIFSWGSAYRHHETREAIILKKAKQKFIRFHWLDDTDSQSFFELRMEKSDITDDYILVITDFAHEDEIDWLHTVWNDNLEKLRLSSGL